MDFRITHRFPCAPDAWWRASKHPDFEAAVARASEVDITPLSSETLNGVRRSRSRVVPRKELPALAQKALGSSRFTYVQETEERDGELLLRWKVLPDVMADKIACGGTLRVVAAPGGCERVIEGQVNVKVMLVGGTIEKAVVEQLQQGYDRAADTLRPVLARLVAEQA